MRVVVTEEARADLRDIGDWIAKDNPSRAASFVRELVRRCQRLATQTARFPIVISKRGRSIRRCVHGAYLVFFEIEPSLNIVRVLHIRHGARDFSDLFDPHDGAEDDND